MSVCCAKFVKTCIRRFVSVGEGRVFCAVLLCYVFRVMRFEHTAWSKACYGTWIPRVLLKGW